MFKETGTSNTGEATSDTEKLSKHHRKAEVNGGGHERRNISYVKRVDHDAWHILYDTLEASDILALFKNDYEVFGVDNQKTDLAKTLYAQYSMKNKKQKRRRAMWDRLFSDRPLDEILKIINTRWLDPDYNFHKEIIRVKKFQLIKGEISNESQKILPPEKLEAYDSLYQSLYPYAATKQLAEDYEVYGIDFTKSELLKTLHEGWANTTDAKIKRTKAWYVLFSGMNASEIAETINTVWCDRGYSLRVETTRIFTAGLTCLV